MLASLVLGACAADGNTVTLTGEHAFSPSSITVEAGTTIEFSNVSSEAHTVTAYEDGVPAGADYFATGGFDKERAARAHLSDGLLTEGDIFRLTLPEPGTYRYFCIPHEDDGMTGTIVVR